MTRLLPVGVCLGLTALWWLAASGSPIFPTPGAVLLGIASLVKDGTLLRHVTASLYRVTYGLGFLIMDSRNAGMRYDLVVAGMVMIGVIGLLLDLVMRRLENLKEVRWRYARGR